MSVNHEALVIDQKSNPIDELAEYFIQFREEAVNKIDPSSTFMVDISEHEIIRQVMEEERVNFRPTIRKALVKAIQFYRTDDDEKRKKLGKVFSDIKIHLIIPETIKIEDLKSSVHEDKIVTFKCEIGTITKPETVSRLNQWYCDACEHAEPHRGALSKVACSGCDGWMSFDKVLSSEDIQRVSLRQSLIDSKLGLKFTLREIEADLHNDYVNRTSLGESVVVTGVFRSIPLGKKKGSAQKTNLPIIDIINIESYTDTIEDMPTYDELQKFTDLNNEGKLVSLLTDSYAYHIYGKEREKYAVLLALLNGNFAKMSRNRMHVFLVGNPSSAKSEVAKYVIKVSHKARYTDGTGSSKAGLLAGYVTMADGRPAIAPGPVVKCDLGHIVVDEFEKMKEDDMKGMLQFMEEGVVNRSLAGEDFFANARTTMIATANPIGGMWDEKDPSIMNNITIPPYVFSRFDLKFKFSLEKTKEERQKVMDWISKTEKGKLDWMLTDGEIRRYLNYVRKLEPELTDDAKKVLDEFHHKLSDVGDQKDTMSIDWRNYGALRRLTVAIAKIRMMKNADIACATEAIELYTYSLATFGISVEEGMTEASKPMQDTKNGREHVLRMSCSNLAKKSDDGLFFESDLVAEMLKFNGMFNNNVDEIKTFINIAKRDKRLIERNGQLKFIL